MMAWHRLVIWGFVALGLAGVPAARASAAASVTEYGLGYGLDAYVTEAGTVEFGWSAGSTWHPLLVCAPADTTPRGLRQPLRVFTRVAGEGAPGGWRGFADRADDDGDGQQDEDRLDGLDNDGDGAIDEDYAGISDFMAVVDRRRGDQGIHLETYHWSYPNLRSLVAMSVVPVDSEQGTAHLTIDLPSGDWLPISAMCRHGRRDDQAPMLLARTADPRGHSGMLWFGVALLDSVDHRGPDARVRRLDRRLVIPVPTQGQALAVSVGPTETQVTADLAEAREVWLGVRDPITGQRVSWLPPPLPAEIPAALVPEATIELAADGTLHLDLAVHRGQDPRFDPQLFAIAGQPLGSPLTVSWRPDGGVAQVRPWSDDPQAPATSVGPDPCGPLASLLPGGPQQGGGVLGFVFPPVGQIGEASTVTLELVHVDGRRVIERAVPVHRPATGTDPADASSAELVANEPELSPALLANYPNPFHDQTQVVFRVPETAGEGFVWADGQAPLIAPEAPVPYRSNPPQVSVRVFGLDGREIATLSAGALPVGDYTAMWDGRDFQGRLQASGTYFCKLQIENWSVTKRLVFIR